LRSVVVNNGAWPAVPWLGGDFLSVGFKDLRSASGCGEETGVAGFSPLGLDRGLRTT
jgi:hypothetical protein